MNLNKYSDNFRKFYDSVFGNRVQYWRDGPDIDSLLSLNIKEKIVAEKLLIDSISKDDSFIFECLGMLGSKAAEYYIKNKLDSCSPSLIPSCALALWRINQDKNSIKEIEKLLNQEDVFLKIDAVNSLSQIDSDQAKEVLIKFLDDTEYLVRYNALRGLLKSLIYDSKEIAQLTSNSAFSNKSSYMDNIKKILK